MSKQHDSDDSMIYISINNNMICIMITPEWWIEIRLNFEYRKNTKCYL